MKTTILLCCLFLCCNVVAQSVKADVIIKRDNTKIEAIIQEINSTTIKYKRFSNQTGPLFTIEKSKVASVLYANGEVESFGDTQIKLRDIPNPQVKPKNDFEVKVLEESDDYLIQLFQREKNHVKNGTVTGIVFTGLAVGCFILGASSEGQNPNSVDGLKKGLLSGAVFGTFASLIWIRRGKHSAKAKYIEQELVRRNSNINSFSLRIQPSYDPLLHAPTITFRASF